MTFSMAEFQTMRRDELNRWAQGDRSAAPPATGLNPPILPVRARFPDRSLCRCNAPHPPAGKHCPHCGLYNPGWKD